MKWKSLIASAAALTFISAGYSCSPKSRTSSEGKTVPDTSGTEDSGELTVTFLSVGKADSMIIRSENSTVVIDCGERGDGKTIVKFLENQGVTAIDCLIVTHFDKDHVGGAAKVINSFEVKKVLTPDYQEFNQETEKFRNAMKERSIEPQLMRQNTVFELDGAEYTVYAPEKRFYGQDDSNDFSLVTKLVYHDSTFIFAGDAMEQRLNEVMDIGDCDLLKVPYHGRKIANLGEFVESVSPEYAVVCTSKEEFATSTRGILDDCGVTCWSTCYNGTVTAVTDGKTITVTSEK
ncbi:MAG: MBL fold metallo-hydrolase [Ruminococcus sp.]|nr:MBL fold metallo-hydrolase [Ruminococcus sp.]